MASKKPQLPEKWKKSEKTIKAMQVAFDLDAQIQTSIRLEAVTKGLSPSDMIRELLDLPVNKPPKRPRLTTSLTEQDYESLAQRFNLDADDKLGIKRLAMDHLIQYVKDKETKD